MLKASVYGVKISPLSPLLHVGIEGYALVTCLLYAFTYSLTVVHPGMCGGRHTFVEYRLGDVEDGWWRPAALMVV